MVAEVGNTRMCVQEASWGVLSWDDCRFSAVLRPNTEPIVTASGDGDNGTGGHCITSRTRALCPGTPLPTPPALQTRRHG